MSRKVITVEKLLLLIQYHSQTECSIGNKTAIDVEDLLLKISELCSKE